MNPDIETTLRDDLHHLVADQPCTPDIDVAEQRGRQLRRRSVTTRGVVALSVVAGVTAAAIAITNQPATHTVEAVPAASAQVIVAHTVAALTAQDAVLRVTAQTTGLDQRGTVDSTDQAAETVYSSGGRTTMVVAYRLVSPGKFEGRMIDFTKRTWSEQSQSPLVAIENPGKQIIDQLRQDATVGTNGRVKVIATGVVDGQLADELALLDTNGQNQSGTMWISRATSLPIKSASPDSMESYQWSGPGSVDPASLWPSVPAGFTQVPPTPLFGKP